MIKFKHRPATPSEREEFARHLPEDAGRAVIVQELSVWFFGWRPLLTIQNAV